jgi:type II secretory pathway pseudopilin PulG
MYNHALKQGVSKAFTMIELIFAIVLIGFVMLAIPQMMQTNTRALEGTMAQEAIFVASTQLAQFSTYHWDGASVDPSELRSTSKILDMSNGLTYSASAPYARQSGTVLRVGGLDQDKHRRFFTNYETPTQSGGLHDFNASITGTAGASGYKELYSMETNISYVNDLPISGTFSFSSSAAATTPTNMKMGIVTIKSGSTVITTLRAYAANIGEVDYAKRSF